MPEGHWDGQTYYGRPQLKPAPFNNMLVGGYVFLAGLSGAAQLLSLLIDLRHGRAAAATVRRGRYLAMLAPTIGTLCLICDLHTPRRFYNMVRLFKTTSPMSLGSWTLVGFSGASTITAAAQFVLDRARLGGWPQALARMTQLPAAFLGGVLATYTASLFSATSTPHWAATPVSLAVRYASASVASAAAAMNLGLGRNSRLGRDVDSIAIAALAIELAATLAANQTTRRAGIGQAHSERGSAIAIAAPLGAFALSLLCPRGRSRLLATAGSIAVLAGSLAMRIDVMRRGDDTARKPELSMRFAQPRTPAAPP